MAITLIESNGYRILTLSESGPMLGKIRDFTDLVGEALSQRATVIAAPVERIDPAFFQLRSGLAGEFVQKIVNYRLTLAVLGDISAYSATSVAWRDFVREASRGRSIFFLPDLAALADKLASWASDQNG